VRLVGALRQQETRQVRGGSQRRRPNRTGSRVPGQREAQVPDPDPAVRRDQRW
jgi:hypothetical protein